MKRDITITKKMTDVMVLLCFDIVEFSRLYDVNAKSIFQCNDNIKKGLKWFAHSESSVDLYNNIEDFLQTVKFALLLYENLNIPMQNKDKIIVQLTSLQKHLTELQNQLH
ncbi:hypothetical protein [Confluentibacter sediminis]|uniref:hypothetical protein n=1 Tax=Confluentibacter sediminis TaxID=2219045 RepID=UPI000DAB6A93|nr:hypothetical protein [Confluentibacter sediminis]